VLVVNTIAVLTSGVLLAIHFLAYVPRVVRSLCVDWTAARRHTVPGAARRAMLVAAAAGGGVALALPTIHAYGGTG
jgi:predicted DCC family thiol-disulfide oxidoreductase YuxK